LETGRDAPTKLFEHQSTFFWAWQNPGVFPARGDRLALGEPAFLFNPDTGQNYHHHDVGANQVGRDSKKPHLRRIYENPGKAPNSLHHLRLVGGIFWLRSQPADRQVTNKTPKKQKINPQNHGLPSERESKYCAPRVMTWSKVQRQTTLDAQS
jgi:hypothetical protein